MKDILNIQITDREWFRPFGPSILADYQHEYLEHGHSFPFMLHVYKIRPEKRPSLYRVNHVDDTGRLQTVTREENPLYYHLVFAFHCKTRNPGHSQHKLQRNGPIVCNPGEAVDCFTRTRMDVLVIGPFIVLKAV